MGPALRLASRATALAAVLCIAAAPATAWAQDDDPPSDFPDEEVGGGGGEGEDDWPTDRPTSGDMSLFSGRTLGNGETALAAGVGWPSIWAGLWLAPSSTFNIGLRGHVYYGSPVMGLEPGVGGGLSIPVRIFLWGKNILDLAILVEPRVVLGEARIVGQLGAFGGNFGMGVTATAGLLAGAQVSEAVTLTFGVAGEGGWVFTPDRTMEQSTGIGGVLGIVGIEALMARDTMLFAEIRGGVGFHTGPDTVFPGQEILRAWLGIAYLL